MKVLVIGNADSIWTKSLIEKTHLPYGDKVLILSGNNTVFTDFYKKNNVKICHLYKIKNIHFLYYFTKNLINFAGHYDLVSVQYAEKRKSFWGIISRVFADRLVVSFWGSDLLRQKNSSFLVKSVIRLADEVTITTDEMVDAFVRLYGSSNIKKIRRTKFGSNGIELIDNHIDVSGLMDKYRIQKDKVVISIGYNKSKQQQHIEVLKVIGSLPYDVKNKIHIVLRLTYGDGDDLYVNQIKEMVVNTKCTFSVFEEYLSDDEVAEITMITDIFIHAQTTDARSASMCEHLYAKCLVINPSWIEYSDLERKVFYLKYDCFDDLRDILVRNIAKKNNSSYVKELLDNSKQIASLCSWDAFVSGWRKVYEE